MAMKTLIATAALAALAGFASAPASAAAPTASPLLKSLGANSTTAELVQYRGCRRVRRMCAGRFPARGWRFQRCMRRRGC
ncbi:MAG: hypothetical protein KDJ36_12300 [Hyphomicrobiaceae bacterium]|nr:hypothetical protein [Hyphomicrobiaceae bacterium]